MTADRRHAHRKGRRRRLRGPVGPQGPLVLGLESGGDHLGVALWRLPEEAGAPPERWRLEAERVTYRGHRHADAVLVEVDAALASAGAEPADLGMIAVGRGPGGFTGVRVGMATGLGVGLGLSAPVWQVDSLKALALHAAGAPGLALPLVDARKGEVYGALYRVGVDLAAVELMAPRVASHDGVLAAAEEAAAGEALHVFGSGALAYGCAREAAPTWHVASARHTALLAALDWDRAGRPPEAPALDPAYVRPSDAELSRAR